MRIFSTVLFIVYLYTYILCIIYTYIVPILHVKHASYYYGSWAKVGGPMGI